MHDLAGPCVHLAGWTPELGGSRPRAWAGSRAGAAAPGTGLAPPDAPLTVCPGMPTDHQLAISERVPVDPGSSAPLVVLVHGSLDRAGSFARVTRRLPELHTVAYDRRGYNDSRHVVPVHTSLAGHVEDLLAVIDGRPSVVIGHSYGGDVALGAVLRPNGPAPILAVGAYEPPLPWLGSWATRNGTRTAGGTRPVDEDSGDVAERFFRRMVGDSAWDRLTDDAKAARRADGAALAADLSAIRTVVAPFEIAELTVPAVFGRGTASLPHHRDAVEWLHTHVPGSGLVEFDGAGHGAHLTHPDAFAQFVRAVVARAAPVGRVPRADG
jgi:pimeloyl-ACP methyl ester carboxylesterase